MKTRIYTSAISILKKVGLTLILGALVTGCIPDIGDNYTTFKGEMIYSYLKKKPELYSEFVAILDRSGLNGMLNAYGTYTCLAPTNDAFKEYYKAFGPNYNIDSLSAEEILYIAKTHIVDNEYITDVLTDGVLPNPNMNKRLISIMFTSDSVTNAYKIVLNDSSTIVSRDNKVYNGVVQGINRVLQPLKTLLPDLIMGDGHNDMQIFSQALKLTGLSDSLLLIKDNKYKPTKIFKDEYNGYEIVNPAERKYGYTALVESDAILNKNGINTLEDLINRAKELYPNGADISDYTNRENSLNIYMSYHLVNKAIYLNKFFYTASAVKGINPEEFIETMYSNHIIRAVRISNRVTLNPNTTNVVQIEETGGKTTLNGVYHLLDNMLVYSQSVEEMLQNTRIRFDIVSLFPEMTNNNLRGSVGFMKKDNSTGDRFGFESGYLKDVTVSKDTRLIYLAGRDGQWWTNYQADELMGLGSYDITIRLLPVPPGTYELRFGYSANNNRSVTQIYIDNKPIGIPLDLKITADNPKIGSIMDDKTDDNGVENDKMMRNRGYMKAPTCFYNATTVARNVPAGLRRIIGTFTFTEYSAHTLRFKSVVENPQSQCMMDYFEYVPKTVFNPSDGTPEGRE